MSHELGEQAINRLLPGVVMKFEGATRSTERWFFNQQNVAKGNLFADGCDDVLTKIGLVQQESSAQREVEWLFRNVVEARYIYQWY